MMDAISLTISDQLTLVIENAIKKAFTNVKEPQATEKPDRIDAKEVKEITGLKESSIYKLTMLAFQGRSDFPVKKFGKRNVFSRKDILDWVEINTKNKPNPSTEAARTLAIQANKKEGRKL